MKFITLDAETFRKFAANSPYKSFTQTPEIAKLREQNGWTAYYFGVEVGRPSSEDRRLGRTALSVSEEDGSPTSTEGLIAAAMLVAKPTFLGKSTYYCPGGPLLDYANEELASFFFKNLRKYIKSHNGYVLHIDPYYELIERARDGEPKEGGFNHQTALKNLLRLGFKPAASTMPKYLFVLDLKKQTVDQIFSDMKRNTRNHIRKAEKMGVKIRELEREELNIFKQITEQTSTRRHFDDRPLSYYEQMYDLFHPRNEVMFLLAEVPGEGVADNVFLGDISRFSSPETYIPDATEKAARRADFPGSPAYDVEGEKVHPRKDMSDRPPSPTPLSVAMFMLYGSEVVYLFSGSDEKYMKDYNAQYLIQWHMIKYAIEHKFTTYNFYGIQGLPNKSSQDYGIYDFKKGFTSDQTGRVVELIGSYELPVNQLFYRLHHFLSKLKHH